MKFDPSDYKKDRESGNGGGNYLPVGKHIVRVIGHEFGRTNGAGLAQLIVTFEARDCRTRKAWLIAEGKAGFQIAMLFEACIWNKAMDLEDETAVRQAFYNKDVEIVVEDDTYKGETKPKVKWINKAPGGFGDGVTPRREEPRGGGGGAPPRDGGPLVDADIPF
jgi:hypothetical protein